MYCTLYTFVVHTGGVRATDYGGCNRNDRQVQAIEYIRKNYILLHAPCGRLIQCVATLTSDLAESKALTSS